MEAGRLSRVVSANANRENPTPTGMLELDKGSVLEGAIFMRGHIQEIGIHKMPAGGGRPARPGAISGLSAWFGSDERQPEIHRVDPESGSTLRLS